MVSTIIYTYIYRCAPTHVTCGLWCSGGREGLNSRSYTYIYIIALALPVRIIIEFYQVSGTIPGNCSAHRASRACVRESMPLILGAILHLLVTTSTPAKRRAAHGTSRLSRNRKAHLVEIASERFPTYSTLGQYQPRLPWMQRPEFSKDESPVRCPPKHAILASDRPHLRVPDRKSVV